MGTSFTIYAIAPGDEDIVQRQMSTSLAYGRSALHVIQAAAREQSQPNWWEAYSSFYEATPSYIIDNDHTHASEGDLCETIRDLIGTELPVLDVKLKALIVEAVPAWWSGGTLEWPLEAERFPHLATAAYYDHVPVAGTTWDTPLSSWTDGDGRVIPQARGLNPRVWRAGLHGFLEGARGRKLWWAFV